MTQRAGTRKVEEFAERAYGEEFAERARGKAAVHAIGQVKAQAIGQEIAEWASGE